MSFFKSKDIALRGDAPECDHVLASVLNSEAMRPLHLEIQKMQIRLEELRLQYGVRFRIEMVNEKS